MWAMQSIWAAPCRGLRVVLQIDSNHISRTPLVSPSCRTGTTERLTTRRRGIWALQGVWQIDGKHLDGI